MKSFLVFEHQFGYEVVGLEKNSFGCFIAQPHAKHFLVQFEWLGARIFVFLGSVSLAQVTEHFLHC